MEMITKHWDETQKNENKQIQTIRKRKGTLEAHEQKRVGKDKEEFWEEFQVKRYKIHGNC